MAIAYSRQKSYADTKKCVLEFYVGYKVYLKISPMKGVMSFFKKGKWSPRYIGPYDILLHVDMVTSEFTFPAGLGFVHPVFHISMLKKCIDNRVSILPIEGLGVEED